MQQCYELYKLYWEKIRRTDEEIAKLLEQTPKDDAVDWDKYRAHLTKGYQKNDPNIDLGRYAYELSSGVDLLHIHGVGHGSRPRLMS